MYRLPKLSLSGHKDIYMSTYKTFYKITTLAYTLLLIQGIAERFGLHKWFSNSNVVYVRKKYMYLHLRVDKCQMDFQLVDKTEANINFDKWTKQKNSPSQR